MPPLRLFLGVPLEGQFQVAFDGADPILLSTFLNAEYLEKTAFNGQIFIGKRLETVAALPQVVLTEAHLRSLFRRLLPDYSMESLSFTLIPHAT